MALIFKFQMNPPPPPHGSFMRLGAAFQHLLFSLILNEYLILHNLS